jgi:Reverse transcriptase (RNA-dependent DNA polymerase)
LHYACNDIVFFCQFCNNCNAYGLSGSPPANTLLNNLYCSEVADLIKTKNYLYFYSKTNLDTQNYVYSHSKTNLDTLNKSLHQSTKLRRVRFTLPLRSDMLKSTDTNTFETITDLKLPNANGPTILLPNANGPTTILPNTTDSTVVKPSTKTTTLRNVNHGPNNFSNLNSVFNKYPSNNLIPKLNNVPYASVEMALSYSNYVKQIPNSSVFLIGDVTLNRPQIDILEKGLSYIPVIPVTPDPNIAEIDNLSDPINKTISKLKFIKDTNNGSYLTRKGLNLLNTGLPVPTKFNYTNKLIEVLHSSHSLKESHSTASSLDKHERNVINSLRNNPNWIIKPVDKNLGIAVIEKNIYIRIVELQHLNDTSTYTKLDSDPLVETIDHVNGVLLELCNNFIITNKTYKQLAVKQNSANGVFYILPKLHKGKLDSRPICANSNHPTRAISEHLHSLLLPIARNAFSFLDNSLELIKMLQSVSTTPSTLIITADIKSLYTRIPTIEGPSLVAKMASNNKLSTIAIETLLSLVLKNNVFSFNNNFYRQKNGTAMGTVMAPSYANCFLKAKEELGLKTWLTPSHPNVKLFKRYIDDILVIFNNYDNKLPQFLNDMRSAYYPLELTFKIGKTSIVYLDTELTINDSLSKIDYELHRKPCNNKTYTPANSNHPNHMLINTIFNDYLRAHRLCSTKLKLLKHTSVITAKAAKRGYKKKTLKRLLHRARITSESKIKTSIDEGSISAFASLTYTGSRTKYLATNFRKYWSSTADPDTKIMLSFKTTSNLKKILVRSKAPLPLC